MPDIFSVGLFSLLILHASYVERMTKKILNNPVFTYIGDISYSIYMVHIPIIGSFLMYSLVQGKMDLQPPAIDLATKWIAAGIFILFVIGIASLTYRFLERPMRTWIKRSIN